MTEFSVLIVDDDVWMQRILAKTLESYGFKKTFLASDGFSGIALAVENTPLLIVMDILMPDLTGLQALRILKQIKTTKNIPVLMVSALSDTENLTMAVKYGTAGFISKPFTRATVFEKLGAIFGKDKVERIAKGEDVNLEPENFVSQIGMDDIRNEFNIFENIPEEAKPSATTLSESPQDSSKPAPQIEQALQFYKEDEKRSIESIKKMLLKNKK
jgi:CheY-like chemotaxis protein